MHLKTRHSVSVLLALLAPVATAHAQTLQDLFPELASITAADGGSGEQLGFAVAVSGDTLAVGAPNDTVGGVVNQGSVRMFVRVGGVWTLQATLTASDGAAGDLFGSSVALSGDTLAVGVRNDDVGAVADQGTVRMFVRGETGWTPLTTLSAADGAASDRFGYVVSLSGDTLAVSAPFDDIGTAVDQGSVRVFVRTAGDWVPQQTLTASDGVASDYFGNSVSVSGGTIAVGAVGDDFSSGIDQGSVRVFTRSGSVWTPQATLTQSDAASYDYFGFAVSLSGDTVAAGALYDDIGFNSDQGSASIFTRSGSAWTLQAKLTASDGAPFDYFGVTIALSGDTLAVGAPYSDAGGVPDKGSVRVFVRGGSAWTAYAALSASDGSQSDLFGNALALSGELLAVGAPYDNIGSNADQGSVKIFGNYRVWNQTRSIGSTTLASAVGSAFWGDRLLVGGLAFSQADGIIDASQKRLTFTALEPLALSSTALMTVATDTVFEKSPAVASGGLTVNGRLVAPINGTVTFQQLTVGSLGQLSQRGSSLLLNQNLATTSGGVCYLEGSVLAQTVSTAVGSQNRVAGDTDVFANYNNAGSTVIQRGILYIYGTLTNTGTITGNFNNGFLPPNPGDGYSIGGDYVVSAESSIILADPVWWLRVGGNFDVAINSASRFVMDQATLELTGTGPASLQSVEVLSRDLGAVNAGFATTNYPLGALRLRAGSSVSLADNQNNAPGKGNEAVYTQQLVVPAGSTLTTNGYKVYTRAATIAGTVSSPGDIIVVPSAPPCPADLFPNGAVDAADLGILLSTWGPCSGSCPADLNADGQVGAQDLALLLASWGPCAN